MNQHLKTHLEKHGLLSARQHGFRNGMGTTTNLLQLTQGLIKTLGSMVIFDENQGVSDLSKYEFLGPIYVKIIKFLVL